MSNRRNDQFLRIDDLIDEYCQAGNPMLSMDTKKKEPLGPYCRPGLLFASEDVPVYDHDFLHAAEGVMVPHGLYDLQRNVGHLYLGLSHDTSRFACDNVYVADDGHVVAVASSRRCSMAARSRRTPTAAGSHRYMRVSPFTNAQNESCWRMPCNCRRAS